jgi:hypothetical protein
MAIRMAKEKNLHCFSALVCHVLVPPALEAIFSDENHGIDGLLAAGHVCTITGYHSYDAICNRFGIPIAITGFEPVDLLRGIWNVVEQLESQPRNDRVVNVYEHIATIQGKRSTRSLLCAIKPGEASASFLKADLSSKKNMLFTTLKSVFQSAAIDPLKHPRAELQMCYVGKFAQSNAQLLEACAIPVIRWVLLWFPMKGLVPPTICTNRLKRKRAKTWRSIDESSRLVVWSP